MRFRSITLKGYVGIYNGMNLMEIHIEFPRTPNRIVLIRGDNGSGKSTIMNALSVMPDNNDQFCPNVPASKHVIIENGQIVYDIYFDHPCSGGNRGQAKAYIKKIGPDGQTSELNPNGNIRSYKEIVYNELGLDSNFIALSALSSENRGLATKMPAERKKFLNSIISQMETYNGIYKALSKKSNELKAMINSIAAKLGTLGDPTTIQSYLSNVEKQINDAQVRKDEAIKNLAEQQAIMKMLDSDGNLLDKAASTMARISQLNAYINEIDAGFADQPFIPNEGYSGQFSHRYNMWKEQSRVDILTRDSAMREIERINAEMATVSDDIRDKSAILAADDVDQEELDSLEAAINDMQTKLDSSIERLREEFGLGIEDMSLTEDDVQMIHSALGELTELASIFKDEVTIDDLQTVPDRPFEDVASLQSYVEGQEWAIQVMESDIANWQKYESLATRRNLIPSTCPGSCILMEEFAEIEQYTYDEINQNLVTLLDEVACAKVELEETKATIKQHSEMNVIINTINRMKRIIKNYDRIFSKIGYHIDITVLIHREVLADFKAKVDSYLASNSALVYVINDASATLASRRNLYAIQKAKLEKSTILVEGLNAAKAKLADLEKKRSMEESTMNHAYDSFKFSKSMMAETQTKIDNAKRLEAHIIERDKLQQEYNANLEQFEKIQQINIVAQGYSDQINQLNEQLEPLFKQRDQYLHTMRMIEDYNMEMAKLRSEYDFIEKVRYYSSPTTGIQLVFMQYYVGNTLTMANELLSRFFGGQFVIQPFIINDTEFRIPCMGDGYINDDISSMSSAQIAMISMVISFSLLYHSSTSFNIPKLDEIDGPLDTVNRQRFVDVLNQIIEIMQIEQCFIISHNGELESANCDVVALKIDPTVPINGNLIFRY